MRKLVLRAALALLFVLLAAAASAGWWLARPLPLAADAIEVSVPQGASLRAAARQAAAAGVQVPAELLSLYFRFAGQGQTIQPGDYAVTRGMRAADLLDKLVRGERVMVSITLVEGWTFRQVRAALAQAEFLRHDSAELSPAELMEALGVPGVAPEGRFFPDTYLYPKHASSELAILRQAMQLMQRRLAAAWEARASDLPLKSPDEALILASIVEKETGRDADRAEIAGVFINRLRADMPLQTDPTVIYGLDETFDGNLTRSHLRGDTPFNTYTRRGLPPTPIAMPGKAALMAAVQPARTSALYFVARGDGSSHFSRSLDEHNRAVNRYQRGGGRP